MADEYARLKMRWDALKRYVTSKRGLWEKRAEGWPKSVRHENTARHLAAAFDRLLEMMEE